MIYDFNALDEHCSFADYYLAFNWAPWRRYVYGTENRLVRNPQIVGFPPLRHSEMYALQIYIVGQPSLVTALGDLRLAWDAAGTYLGPHCFPVGNLDLLQDGQAAACHLEDIHYLLLGRQGVQPDRDLAMERFRHLPNGGAFFEFGLKRRFKLYAQRVTCIVLKRQGDEQRGMVDFGATYATRAPGSLGSAENNVHQAEDGDIPDIIAPAIS